MIPNPQHTEDSYVVPRPHRLHWRHVRDIVARHYGLQPDDISDMEWRSPIAARARAVFYWLLRQQGRSFPHIARIVNRDHTTIVKSTKRLAGLRKSDPILDAEMKMLLAKIGGVG